MRWLAYILIPLTVVACEMDSEIELHDNTTAIMTSFIYKDSSLVVYLYSSVSYSDTAMFHPLGEADVVLCYGDKVFTSRLSDGQFSVDFGKVDIDYGEVISVFASSELYNLSAKTTLLRPVSISSVDTMTVGDNLEFVLKMKDVSNVSDYYQIQVRRKRFINGTEIISVVPCDFSDYVFYLANSTLTNSLSKVSSGLFTDELIFGRWKTLHFTANVNDLLSGLMPGEEAKIEVLLYRHTYDYYNFERTSMVAQGYLILPVFGIPTIHSNVNGGVGIVSGMAFDKYELYMKK